MRMRFVLFAGIAAACPALVAGLVGKPASAVTVPLESVTVDEAAIRATISPAPPSQMDLLKKVRSTELPEAKRLAALAQIQDQDAIFQLIFKPGSDTNQSVRVAAVQAIADHDILWFLKTMCRDERVSAVAAARLAASGPPGNARDPEQCKRTVQAYVQRMRGHHND